MPDEPLRILQVLRAPIGGLFRHVVDLSHGLAARGHAVGLVIDRSRTDAQTDRKLDMIRPALELGIHTLPMPRLLGVADVSTPVRLRRLAAAHRVHILHGHGAKGGMNARLAGLGMRRTAKLYTPHGGVLNYRPGSAIGKLMRAIERKLLTQTDAIIFESAYAERAFGEQVARPDCLSRVIHNGLAPAEFEPVPLASDPFDFVFVGELRDLKGLPFLLQALVDVRRPGGRPATLLIAGDGPDRDTTAARIARLGLTDRVRLAGVQPAREMFAQGRCVVVPSLAESLPYVVLEAAAAQKPVIATNVGGIAEIFGPTAGALLPPGNAKALQRAMQANLDNPAQAEAEMAQRLDHVRSRFTVNDMTDAILEVYRQALAGR